MRTTTGKPTTRTRLLGDKTLATDLSRAVEAVEMPVRYAHGFHTYPAGLHPDAARDLIQMFGGSVFLDPFMGGGTTLIEARARGMYAIGRDVSPTAVRVAKARTAAPDEETLTLFRSTSRKLTAIAREVDPRDVWPDPETERIVADWYAPCAMAEIESLRRGIDQADGSVRFLLEAALSSLLVKVSWRRSDTSRERVIHRRPPGTTAVLFHKKCRELARRLADYREAVPTPLPELDIKLKDARSLVVPKGTVDLVVTSPPYPATYDYLPLQTLRDAWFCRWGEGRSELGSRREWRSGERAAYKAWKGDTRHWMERSGNALRKGGVMVIVIGDGRTPGGPVDAFEPTINAAEATGLTLLATASLERPDYARDFSRWEHIFAFQV